MKHLSEFTEPYTIENYNINLIEELPILTKNNVVIFDLSKVINTAKSVYNSLKLFIDQSPSTTIYNFIGNHELIAELAYLLEKGSGINYQYLITLRKKLIEIKNGLPCETLLLLTVSKEKKIKINRVLLPYTYCPACEKTTKDYGGKKHTLHHFGTTMSDIWKDVIFDIAAPLTSQQNMIIVERITLMLSKRENKIITFDMANFIWESNLETNIEYPEVISSLQSKDVNQNYFKSNAILQGDSIEKLKSLPSNSIDYVFIDPPYNLEKRYSSYSDDMDIENYFKWCDEWIEESLRVLRAGAYLSILNIPQWCIRHFAYLIQRADFNSWITWDALSKPAGFIMPANYTILTFRKRNKNEPKQSLGINLNLEYMQPLEDGYCLRESCIKKRLERKTKPLTDLWTDIHRLKHNSLRYDHPCQLPPDLMKRVIEIFTKEREIVLDFFNGVGTTTLTAELTNREYLGVELDPTYVEVARRRHEMIQIALDPFAKNNISDNEKTKNNTLKRVMKRKEEHKHINKKEVQLKMKALYAILGKKPTIEDALEYHPEIPVEFYELYFKSWSEVLAALKVSGVNEKRHPDNKGNKSKKRTKQQSFELEP